MMNLLKIALAALLLLALVLVVNAGVFDANWRWDDSQILLHSHQYSFWQDFTRPEVWQQFSPANLTPWLIFSFEVDMILFGLSPAAFYLHQLLAIVAAGLLLFMCLNLWCRAVFALAGSVLFVVGLPSMLVAEQLMTRHYVEGLVFALAALYGFVMYLRTDRKGLLAVAVLMYVLAVTAKEIYVPLPALLLLVPDRDWGARIKASLPFFAVTVLYTLWRGYMLGSYSGGYVDSSEYLSLAIVGEVLASFVRFPALLTGIGWPVLVLLFLGLWAAYLARSRRVPWRALLVAALVLLPLVPLVRSPGIVLADRYLLLPWLMVCFALAWCVDKVMVVRNKAATGNTQAAAANTATPLPAMILAGTAMPIMVAITLLHAMPVRQALASVGTEFDVQAQFLWQNEDTHAFVPSGNVLPAFWFVTGLVDLKARISGQGSPLPMVDDIYLAQQPDIRLFTYDVNCQCMRDVTGAIPERLAQHRARVRADAALSLSYRYQQGYFSWQFGPWQDGSYHVVSDTLGVLPLPPAGQLRVTLADNAPFYLRYTSPEGWITYSELNRVVQDGAAVEWSRN
ncbi:hypothetical protein [Pseudohongiella sp.]|uniref:Glycosyltransferase RgtA/B/C/D-like domain-containing protein n=1 Tax=marine sediment metagenome TaxID=412755 RepID=A0A0F9Z517_9ZZZZ|nr:hypothetical protein [Pseudohongiella sp.]HDZ09446.1 hypothetical protein [Pseudohongiella sp.]HEA63963.1 hypothetical protein [Pseudohongiella sp.]